MEILKVDSRNINKTLARAIEVLHNGGVIAHSTDTVWGLACDAGSPKAIQKIHKMKGSDPSKPLLLNLPSKTYLNKIGSKLCKAHKLTQKFWSGSLSLIIQGKDRKSKIGVRFPDHKISNLLAKKFGKSLITTSANLSGKKVAKDAQEVAKTFGNAIDLILDDGSKSRPKASTLVDVSGKEVSLIREGEIPFRVILQTLSSRS